MQQQQASFNMDQSSAQSLKQKAFNALIDETQSLYFLLDDQLCIQALNKQACHFFSISIDKMFNEHLPAWFVESGWVPPLIHFQSAKKQALEKGAQTKVVHGDHDVLIDWIFEWIEPEENASGGLLLKGLMRVVPDMLLPVSETKSTEEKPSIFQAISGHLTQLTSLAGQTLQHKQQEVLELKIALQNVLQSIEQCQSLLTFAYSLEQSERLSYSDGEAIELQKVLQKMIAGYQSEHPSLQVQIALETKQMQKPMRQLWNKEQIEQGVAALILPLINFLEKGSVRIQAYYKMSDANNGLAHIQCQLKGEDAFGQSIQDWLAHEGQVLKTHKTLYLHWLLGKEWLERSHGLYQTHINGSEVHIDMMLPCELEQVVKQPEVAKELEPVQKVEKAEKPQIRNTVIEPPPINYIDPQPQQIITEVTASSNVNFIKPKAYKPFEYDNPCDPQKLTLRSPKDCAILFVEDLEVSIRAVLQMVHTRYENVFFKVAVTASKALEAFKRDAYDLVIMDIGLPDNKDLEMALEMRQLEKQFGRKPAPICILSGHFGEEHYRKVCPPELQDSLIQRFYTKPMVSLSMRDVISRYLPNAVLRKERVLEAS